MSINNSTFINRIALNMSFTNHINQLYLTKKCQRNILYTETPKLTQT